MSAAPVAPLLRCRRIPSVRYEVCRALYNELRADANDNNDKDTDKDKGFTHTELTDQHVADRRNDDGRDSVGSCGDTANKSCLIREKLYGVADGLSVSKTHGKTAEQAEAYDQHACVLCQTADDKAEAEQYTAGEDNPFRAELFGNEAAGNHGDKTIAIAYGKYD